MGRLNLRLVQILILMEMRAFSVKMRAFSPNLHKMHAFSPNLHKMHAFSPNLHKMHAFSPNLHKMQENARIFTKDPSLPTRVIVSFYFQILKNADIFCKTLRMK